MIKIVKISIGRSTVNMRCRIQFILKINVNNVKKREDFYRS